MGTDNTDKIAFVALLALAALTGVICYYAFSVAAPKAGVMESIYRQDLPPQASASNAEASKPAAIDESKYTNKIPIKIQQGASTQGNPNYDPNSAKASSDALITWTNGDTVPHTATSGTGPQDPQSGKLFDSGILSANGKFSVPAEKLGKGEHPYYCTVHPFMTGKIIVS